VLTNDPMLEGLSVE
jgi:hypothetical protein